MVGPRVGEAGWPPGSPYAGEPRPRGHPSPSRQPAGHAQQLRAVTPYRRCQRAWLCVAGKSISPPASSLDRETTGSVIKCLEEMKQHRRISICGGKAWRSPRPGALLNVAWCSARLGCRGGVTLPVCTTVARASPGLCFWGCFSGVLCHSQGWHGPGAPAADAGRAPAPRVLQPWQGNLAPRVRARNAGAVRAVSVSPQRRTNFFFLNNSFASFRQPR